MDYSITEESGVTVIRFAGEIDLESASAARNLLLARIVAGENVMVDLSAVRLIDSSGIASLVEAYQKARDGGLAFGLIAVNDAAMRVLRLARLETVFPIFPDLAAAKAAR